MTIARSDSPRRRPLQDRSRATVEAIVEAATRILIEQGRARLTTNRIAVRAGVGVGSLYGYFPHKHAIVAEIARRRDAAVAAELEPLLEGERPAAARLAALVRAYVGAHASAPALHRELLVLAPASPERARSCVAHAMSVLGVGELGAWTRITALRATVEDALGARPEAIRSGALASELVTLVATR